MTFHRKFYLTQCSQSMILSTLISSFYWFFIKKYFYETSKLMFLFQVFKNLLLVR